MEFRLLGPLEVHHDGTPIGLGGPRERAVLGALLLRANEFAGVSYLVDAVWDAAPASPETNLRTYVAGLRRRLGSRPDGGARLLTRDGGYVLVVDADELDVTAFEDLVERGGAALADDDPAAAAEALRSALDRWRGEPLEGCRLGPGLRADVDRLRERRLRAVEQLAAARIQLGEHAGAVDDLRQLVTQYPLREELWAQLMIGLCRSARRAEALEVYAEVRRRLVDELGVEPGTRLRQLHAEILADDAELGPRMAAEPAVRPAQLPADLPAFVGRDEELTRLLAPLADGASLAVSISSIDGMAGIGKTALAVHAAHQLADRYPDGQLFVDLHGHTVGVAPTEPAKALDQLLRALGVPGETVPHEVAAAAALYRSRLAGQRILIVLDNAADEAQIEPLLPGTPGCLVLITSRRRLTSLDHAVPVTLDVLPLPDAVALFTGITGRPDDLVPDIVRLCGQLPLAIRIAAARLRARPSWTLAHLADRLRDHRRRLGELSAGQRGVAAAIDLSYDQLDPVQQRVFRLLGLHPGTDIDVTATAALTDVDRDAAEDVLETLLDAHLLHQHHADRYQFHDLVRAYAARACADQEPEADSGAALTRLLDHYAARATAAMDVAYPNEIHRRPRWPDPTEAPADAAAWLNAELGNLLDVAAHAAVNGWPAHTVHLSATLSRHLDARAYLFGAERLHTEAVTCARHLDDRAGELAVLNAAGQTLQVRGRHDLSVDCFDQALDLARELEDRWGELAALRGRGNVLHMCGRFASAADHYRQALAIAREIGDHGGECDLLRGISDVHRVYGEYDAAIEHYERALRIASEHGDRDREIYVRYGLGNAHHSRGSYDEAADCYASCRQLAQSTGNRKGELYSLMGLGDLHLVQARPEPARDCYCRALDLARTIGNRNYEFEALLGLGNAHLTTEEPSSALTRHQEAADLATTLGQASDQVRAHDGIARAHHALGHPDQARSHWARCLTLLDTLGLTEIEDVDADTVRANLSTLNGGT